MVDFLGMRETKHNRRRISVAAAGLCLTFAAGAAVPLSAQANDGPVLRTPGVTQSASPHAAGPRMVRLPVLVLDKHGQPVTNLQASQFTLTEDGAAQNIGALEPASAMPLHLGVLMDTSRAMQGSFDAMRKAGSLLVDGTLPAGSSGHEAFLIHFDREVELLQDFSSTAGPLDQELSQLGPTAQTRERDQGPETMGDDRQRPEGNRAGRQLYDAIYLSADQMMKSKKGLKALVVLSNGEDIGSKETLNEAIDAAERNHCMVYTVYLKGEESNGFTHSGLGRPGGAGGGYPGGGYPGGYPGGGYPGGNPGGYPGGNPGGGGRSSHADGRRILQQIATRTGGRYLVAKKKDELPEIFADIVNDLKAQFVLTYTPAKPDDEGGFHKVALKAADGDWLVIVPEGYYAPGGDAQQ